MHGEKFEKSSTLSVFFEPDPESLVKTSISGQEEDHDDETADIARSETAYKKNYLINRDVLKFCNNEVKVVKTFKTWDITGWLVKNNSLIRNSAAMDTHRRPSNKIKNRLKPVSRLLDNLVGLGIIFSKNIPSNKGNSDTKEYKFTHSGYLIALLLERDESEKQSINNEIYNFLFSSYENLSTSYSRFSSIFLKKCKEKGYLDKYISHHIQHLKDNCHLFSNTSQYLQSVNYYLPFYKEIYRTLLQETLKELDKHDYQLYLYDLKLKIEDMQLRKVKAYANFEEIRFELKEEFDKIALEGYCPNCKHYRSARADLLLYMKNQINSGSFQTKCPDCDVVKIDFDTIFSLFIP